MSQSSLEVFEALVAKHQSGEHRACLGLGLLLDFSAAEYPRSFPFQLASCSVLIRSGEYKEPLLSVLNLMSYVAVRPEAITERSRLQNFFAREIPDTTAAVMLTSLLAPLVIATAEEDVKRAKAGNKGVGSILDLDDSAKPEDLWKFIDLVRLALKKNTVLGVDPLPNRAVKRARPEFARAIVEVIMSGEAREGLKAEELLFTQQILLHALAGIARKFDDPYADFIGLHAVIGYWGLHGQDPQCGRNFAESGLLQLRLNQPRHRQVRTILSWLCWADAAHRAHQPEIAAQMLIFAHLARPRDLTLSWLWIVRDSHLGSRILRDLHQYEMAAQVLSLRKQTMLCGVKNPAGHVLLEFETAEVALELAEAGGDSVELRKVLDRVVALLRRTNAKERTSLVNTALGAVRVLRLRDELIPEGQMTVIAEHLELLEPAAKAILAPLLTPILSADRLRELVRGLPETSFAADVAATAITLLPIAFKALPISVQLQDSELFLLAVGLLTQPGLTVTDDNSADSDAGEWREALNAGEQDPTRLAAAYVRSRREFAGISLRGTAEITTKEIKALLVCEQALILATDEENRLYALEVGTGTPYAVGLQEWIPEAFREWKKLYPAAYGKWTPTAYLDVPAEITEDEVIESVRPLKIGATPAAQPLVLFPNASLLNFPFNLSLDATGVPLVRTRPVTIAPSAYWLWSTRRKARASNRRMVSWMGSPETPDFTLIRLRQRLHPAFSDAGVTEITTPAPREASGASLAFVGSHGGTGLGGRFTGVDDRDHEFTPAEFASCFRDCGCVVLFVCSAAATYTEFSSTETNGLLKHLFSVGVRTVVACPWPLAPDVAIQWTGPFLREITAGQCVSIATWRASQEIPTNSELNHPSAWAALHVYGDGSFMPLPSTRVS